MKLVALTVAAVAIIGLAVASYVHYTRWSEQRYDALIDEAARRHNLDPALVKALVRTQADSPQPTDGRRLGLMQISESAATWYLQDNEKREREGGTTYLPEGKRAWGYICMHRDFPNHDRNKREQFTSNDLTQQPTCRAPGCGQHLIYEPLDDKINLEIGCYVLRQTENALQDFYPGLPSDELERRTVIVYRYRLQGKPGQAFTTTPEQERFAAMVLQRRIEYHPTFERLAQRRAAD